MDSRFTLSDADGLDEDCIEACGLAEYDRLTCLTGYAAE